MGQLKILVSGGTGFLGSHLVKALISGDNKVTVLKRKKSSLKRLEGVTSLNFIDVEQTDSLLPIFDIFIHAATSYGRSGETEQEIYSSNIDLPLKILSKIQSVKLLVINLDTILPPELNHYAGSKRAFVNKVKVEFHHLKFVNLKLGQFYGAHDGGLVSNIIEQLIKKVPMIDVTEGHQERQFVYFQDVIKVVTKIIDARDELQSSYEEFSFAGAETISIRSLLEKIAELCSVSSNVFNWGGKKIREGEPLSLLVRSKFPLRFEPISRTSLEEGLKKTIGVLKEDIKNED